MAIVNLEPIPIGSPEVGVNLYQIPNATMEVMEDLINATWELALSKSDTVSAKTAAITAGGGMFDPNNAPSVTVGTVVTGTASAGAATAGTVAAPDAITAASLSAGTVAYPTATASPVSAGAVSSSSVTSSAVTAGAVSSGAAPVPTITAPDVYIPSSITMPDLWLEWKTQYLEIAEWLVGEYTTWIATYAPNNQALYTAAENSLLAAIQNDSYLPPSVQEQIWGDDAARILSDKTRAQDAVVAQFSARRFPMPLAASVSAVMQIEQKAQDALAESSRKIAVMSVEQYRFVIQQAMSARDMVLKAANDYIRALAGAPDMASKLVGIGYDIQTKLISAAAAFYNADANAKDVIAKVSEFNVSSALEASKTTSTLSLEASKTTSSLALEASKTTSTLALEASKTTSSLALEASKTTSTLSLEASKINTDAAIDAGKTNVSLALEADKAAAALSFDASKTNASLSVEVGKLNTSLAFDASKTNAALSFDASKLNTTLGQETSKQNVAFGLEAEKFNKTAQLTIIEDNLKALLGDITSVTQQAVSALNNLHIGVTMQAGGTTVTTQNQDL